MVFIISDVTMVFRMVGSLIQDGDVIVDTSHCCISGLYCSLFDMNYELSKLQPNLETTESQPSLLAEVKQPMAPLVYSSSNGTTEGSRDGSQDDIQMVSKWLFHQLPRQLPPRLPGQLLGLHVETRARLFSLEFQYRDETQTLD